VVPKARALSCAQCHPALTKAPYCGKCHQERQGVNFEALSKKGFDFTRLSLKDGDTFPAGVTDYIDFKALGYTGDPIETGGRFNVLSFGKSAQKGMKTEPQ
jgi:hypothetical protein